MSQDARGFCLLSKEACRGDTVRGIGINGMDDELRKYPRTRHIEGSGLQKGDHDLKIVPFTEVADGRHLVVEEKVDGANVGISFGPGGDLRLQCRGHYLTGGPGEAQFSLLKPWAAAHQATLRDLLGTRYLCYGEWLYAKHTVFYDALPHYFLEFDVFDRKTETFLSTDRRHALFAGSPVVSVPVVSEGKLARQKDLERLIQPSLYKSADWRERLHAAALAASADPDRVAQTETDRSDRAEGLYLKWERDGKVIERYKWVRRDFLNAILKSGSHWRDRPLIVNGLADDVDIFRL